MTRLAVDNRLFGTVVTPKLGRLFWLLLGADFGAMAIAETPEAGFGLISRTFFPAADPKPLILLGVEVFCRGLDVFKLGVLTVEVTHVLLAGAREVVVSSTGAAGASGCSTVEFWPVELVMLFTFFVGCLGLIVFLVRELLTGVLELFADGCGAMAGKIGFGRICGLLEAGRMSW